MLQSLHINFRVSRKRGRSCSTNGKQSVATYRKIATDDESKNVGFVGVLASTTYMSVECEIINNDKNYNTLDFCQPFLKYIALTSDRLQNPQMQRV